MSADLFLLDLPCPSAQCTVLVHSDSKKEFRNLLHEPDLPFPIFFWSPHPISRTSPPPINSDYFFHQRFNKLICDHNFWQFPQFGLQFIGTLFAKRSGPQFIGALFCKTDQSAIYSRTFLQMERFAICFTI